MREGIIQEEKKLAMERVVFLSWTIDADSEQEYVFSQLLSTTNEID